MKHKRQSICMSKILDGFSGDGEKVAIYESETKRSELTQEEFELVLLSISEGSCETCFTLQKFINPEISLDIKADFKLETVIPLEKLDNIEEVLQNSKKIMQYIAYCIKPVIIAKFHWVFSSGIWYITSVLLEKQTDIKIRCSSARSHNLPTHPGTTKTRSRPVTASQRRDSTNSLKSYNEVKKRENEIETQTNPLPSCKCDLEVEKLKEDLEKILNENSGLEDQIRKLIKQGEEDRLVAEEKWKNRCWKVCFNESSK